MTDEAKKIAEKRRRKLEMIDGILSASLTGLHDVQRVACEQQVPEVAADANKAMNLIGDARAKIGLAVARELEARDE